MIDFLNRMNLNLNVFPPIVDRGSEASSWKILPGAEEIKTFTISPNWRVNKKHEERPFCE